MITFVSCFYPLNGKYRPRSLEDYLDLGTHLMDWDVPLLFFTNDEFIQNWVKEKRGERRTKIEQIELNNLSFFQEKDLLEKRMKEFMIWNLNTKKDTSDYILLQCSKIDFLEKAILLNPFQSSHFVWIDFGIHHCSHSKKEDWDLMKLDWEWAFETFPDKIHQLKISHVFKPTHQSWKQFFQQIYHHIAGGLFGGSLENIKFYIETFKKKWKQILEEEGWYQLDEAIMTIISEENQDKFRFWYGDYDGIIQNIRKSKTSFPLLFQQIQIYLDKRDYKSAREWTETLDPKTPSDLEKKMEFLVQIDYYLEKGKFSNSLLEILENYDISETFIKKNWENLKYYQNDSRYYRILLKLGSKESLIKWKKFSQQLPKIIYMNQSKEFPFLNQETNLLQQFRSQFSNLGCSVCSFYKLLENPSLPLAFLWTHPPPNNVLVELCYYIKRNFPSLLFCFVYLETNEFQTDITSENNMLPFHFYRKEILSTDEFTYIQEWLYLLFGK